MAPLAHTIVRAEGKTPTRSLLFLHGILGSGTNWRGFAKRLLAGRPGLEAWLADLGKFGHTTTDRPEVIRPEAWLDLDERL